MKLTPLALKVLIAMSKLPHGCGGRFIADVMNIYCGKLTGLRGGQYGGRLVKAGWLHKEDEWYTGKRGNQCFIGVRYWISEKGKQILMRTAILIFLMATAAWGQSKDWQVCSNTIPPMAISSASEFQIVMWKLERVENMLKEIQEKLRELEKKIEALKVRENPNPFILPYSPVVTNAFPYNGDLLFPLINQQGATNWMHIPLNMLSGNLINTTEAK